MNNISLDKFLFKRFKIFTGEKLLSELHLINEEKTKSQFMKICSTKLFFLVKYEIEEF